MHTVRLLRYFSSQRECFKFHLNDFSNLNTHIVFHNLRLSQVVAAEPLQNGSQYIPPNHDGYSKSRSSLAVARIVFQMIRGGGAPSAWGCGKMKNLVICTALYGLHPGGKKGAGRAICQ